MLAKSDNAQRSAYGSATCLIADVAAPAHVYKKGTPEFGGIYISAIVIPPISI